MKHDKRLPAEGEVWASPCQFSYRLDEDGIKTDMLKVGINRNGDGEPVWDLEGYELRTVVAVVDLPGKYQKRVLFTRQFSPDGHKPFGKRSLHCAAISTFNSWRRGTLRRHMKPATLVQESHVEKAVKALEAA